LGIGTNGLVKLNRLEDRGYAKGEECHSDDLVPYDARWLYYMRNDVSREFLRVRRNRSRDFLGIPEGHCTFMLAHRTGGFSPLRLVLCCGLQNGCYPESDPQDRACFLDDRLKELMQELGNAINESLSDSDRIAAAIGEIKRAGYDVFLVLEATIGFNKRREAEDEEVADAEELPKSASGGRIQLTSQDQKFLRALKIQIDEDSK
jgi:hypothetical protein